MYFKEICGCLIYLIGSELYFKSVPITVLVFDDSVYLISPVILVQLIFCVFAIFEAIRLFQSGFLEVALTKGSAHAGPL